MLQGRGTRARHSIEREVRNIESEYGKEIQHKNENHEVNQDRIDQLSRTSKGGTGASFVFGLRIIS